ncbi:MAG: AsmA family protein [Candidatus Omnitrophota bacterium]
MKKVFIILSILVLLLAGGLVYLNKVFLPTKIKFLIVSGLQERTHKEVTLEALNFSIFKGLVITNLVIGDQQGVVAKIERASCGFLIFPIFKKTFVIPTIKIESAFLFLERKKDKTFNLQELFSPDTAAGRKPGFNLFVRRVSIKRGRVSFVDNSLAQPFSMELQEAKLNLYLSLPDKVRFNFNGRIAADPAIKLKASGAYAIAAKELSALVYLQDFSPEEFRPYYSNFSVTVSGGRIDSRIELKYNAQEKRLSYSGKATLINLGLQGVDFIGQINEINAEATFDNMGVSAQNLSAVILGLPVRANFNLADFDKLLINAEAASEVSLAVLQGILKDKFTFSLPADIEGNCIVYVILQGGLRSAEPLRLNGYLDISQARIKPHKLKDPFENVEGRIEFSQGQLNWPALGFDYLGKAYRSSGTLIDFKAPQVQFTLSSDGLAVESAFAVSDKLIKLSRLSGRYFNSRFAVAGEIDITKPPDYYLDLKAEAQIDLRDSKEILKGFAKEIEKINPGGVLDVKAALNGNAKDFKSCVVTARLSSDALSFYGLKSQEFFLDYNQANGLAGIPVMRLSLYSGTLKGNAQIELYADNLPCRISAVLENLKIEKLKADTPFKEQDISGTLSAQAVLNAGLKDIPGVSGSGEVFITDGKLWQLNLFKGLGALIFVKDFANIIFREGHCGFVVRDKHFFTDNLKLSSNIADLDGSLSLGFDGSIDALLNVKIVDEEVPLTGTFRDITTAIVGQGGKLGTIEVGGTLSKPEYKFKVSVVDIIKGIKETFFRRKD